MDVGVRPPVSTTCPYCGVGCGVIARASGLGVSIEGDVTHPANFGRLCSKGSALGETVGLEDRLLYPEMDGKRVKWDAALDRVASEFSSAVETYGPDSVAFYVSGQLLTEDYYVANKLMKGYIGSANIDTNSRLCMASSVAGHKRAFGSDTVPGTYEDLEDADLIVLVGSNLAWCHPVLFQRIAAAKEKRPEMRVVLIDPRRTATAELADLHLAARSDSDIAIFNGLLRHLARSEAVDLGYISDHTTGLDDALKTVRGATLDWVVEETGVPAEDVQTFFNWVTDTERTVTVYSQGVNQSATGTDTVNSIINTHLLTGRIGQPGMGPFSVTGQPNAMGGREVGGLANMLACHMEIANADHREIVQGFWQSPTIAAKQGLKAVDLFDAIHEGKIKALWVMATNPADSMPNGNAVETALQKVPFLVVSDVVSDTDTLRHADVKLPAAAWGEKDGTVTNSERRISRQRAFLTMPGEARADWRIICDVAARMGHGHAFAFDTAAEVFDEYAELSGVENDGARDFDISGLAGMSASEYESLDPIQWPVAPGRDDERFFAGGGFFTPDRKARFIPVSAPDQIKLRNGRLVLNTGRVRDHWHTMTRTARSARLSAHLAEPFLEIHPRDAKVRGIEPASLVELKNDLGRAVARALVTDRVAPGTVFMPMHWTDQTSGGGRVDKLVAPITDPTSGQPALKSSSVTVTKYEAAWYGFCVSRERIDTTDLSYWALSKVNNGFAFEIAGLDPMADPLRFAEEKMGIGGNVLSALDNAQGAAQIAKFDGEGLVAALFIARDPVAVSRKWAGDLLSARFDDQRKRLEVLAGRPRGDAPDPGPTICACFGVGANTIATAIADGCNTVDAIGASVSAGTNCGSCRSEIARMIANQKTQEESDERVSARRHATQPV
ncbi:MAG: nitrate reductase [Pseudomonadota bacterium]